MYRSFRFILIVTICCHAGAVFAQDTVKKELDIAAQCDIYMHTLPRILQNDTGIGIDPIEVNVSGVKMISFEQTTGIINFCPWSDTCQNGNADGSKGHTATSPQRGMSGVGHDKKMGFLVGVFTSSYLTPESLPENLNVTKMENMNHWGPELGQVFFIGDGLTEKGETQYILVPGDADKLYLGFADGLIDYRDNTGSIHTTIVLHKTSAKSAPMKKQVRN